MARATVAERLKAGMQASKIEFEYTRPSRSVPSLRTTEPTTSLAGRQCLSRRRGLLPPRREDQRVDRFGGERVF